MAKKKFGEFYLEGDKNYPEQVYWDLYDNNRFIAEGKYDGHMFCPLCKKAPLTVVKGNERRYFKVVESDMNKHEPSCSYIHDQATKKEADVFYLNLDNSKIKNRLVSCMNAMLKKIKSNEVAKINRQILEEHRKADFFTFETEKRKYKYLPHKSLIQPFDKTDFNIQKIFYGECKVNLKFHSVQENVYICYLKLLTDNNKQICEVEIKPWAYNYMKDELNEIINVEKYYICFATYMDEKEYITKTGYRGKSKKCIIGDSRLIVIEKVV